MSQVDLNDIKSQVQTILQNANTSGASPVDLSKGITTRVQKVLKISPERIPIQASFFPYVTMFYDQKTAAQADIAKNMSSGKRRATVSLFVVGAVFLHQITDPTEDDADNDVENLMENVEEILRSNDNLNNSVLFHRTSSVTYHNVQLEEEAFLRTGIMTLESEVFY